MIRRLAPIGNYDLVYTNSIGTAFILRFLRTEDRPVLSHVHELSFPFSHVLRQIEKDLLFDRTDRFIACSGAVRDVLVEEQGVSPDKVTLCYEFIDPPDLVPLKKAERKRGS